MSEMASFRYPKYFSIDQVKYVEPGLMRLRHFGHASDELLVRILCFQILHPIEKRSALRPAVRVEELDSVRKLLLRRTERNASERREADATRHVRCRSLNIDKGSLAAGRSFDLYRGTRRHRV